MTLTDEQVIAALTGSDEPARRAALHWLCFDKPLQDTARSVLLRMNAREADLDDILQEARIAFLRTVERGQFQGRSSLKTYYAGICRNILLNRYLPGKDIGDISKLPLSGTEESAERQMLLQEAREERKQVLDHLFGQLGKRCSEALTLYNRGFPMDRISSDLGLRKVQSAKNLVHRCRERFRELLMQNETAMNVIKSRL